MFIYLLNFFVEGFFVVSFYLLIISLLRKYFLLDKLGKWAYIVYMLVMLFNTFLWRSFLSFLGLEQLINF